ncbi:unnamed protein product [Rodentolepis nana]|uniref:Cadherin domain-containing protein n=1 Tax=Rodentolepis nana TaxID=102285 RepID=A0A0R3TEV0_RODNA|nr:unnamed protein product [Rodentolepis nana]
MIRMRLYQLDREAIERITLIVLVTDARNQPIFTATTTVSIEILDENDNSPVFVNPPANMQSGDLAHAFTIRENSPKFTRLSGLLEARDPDAVSLDFRSDFHRTELN